MPTCNDEGHCSVAKTAAENKNRRRRPATFARTGRRRVVAEPSSQTSTLIRKASERHTNIRHETGSDAVATLNRLLNTLEESGIPGPQLFRLKTEFSHALGQGGQGNVRGLDKDVAQRYQMADKRIQKVWPAKMIAIKQHIERKDSKATTARFNNQDLASRFRAAECEVLALSPSTLRNHPNIVKLVGWGLCLDTLENPSSRCCRGLQLPLLVFERAEMDFANFLGGLFPEPFQSHASMIEEGLAGPPEDSSLPSSMHHYWKSLGWMLGTEPDAYEVVRLLCIDVGHGIQCLHENGFSHGDLKPNNVLVFNTRGRWVAKLCDFGCAVGQVTTGKAEYFGTPYWLPEASEIEALDSRHSLQQCDIYVYGLLVWSAFCLRGQHPPTNPKLHNALDDVNKLFQWKHNYWFLFASNRRKLVAKVARLLEETLVDRSRRDVEPWTWLYHKRGTRQEVSSDLAVGASHNSKSNDQVPNDSKTHKSHITLEMKARYHKLSWWQRDNEDIILPGEQDYVAEPRGDTDIGIYLGRRPGPASSEALSPEINSLGTTLFVSQRSRAISVSFRLRMKKHLDENQMSSIRRTSYVLPLRSSQGKAIRKYQEWCENLYHMARFRSRIGLQWWGADCTTLLGDTNIVEMALAVSPPVDITTLAWLCAGPVGKAEVNRLKPDFSTWKSMLVSSDLDESARLDRFLLLLQFGARVEQRVLGRRGPLQDFNIESQWDSGTIFSLYIRSCRPATIPTIIREIDNRLSVSRVRGFVSNWTLRYFVGTHTPRGLVESAEAESDCMRDQNVTAVKALRQFMSKSRRLVHFSNIPWADFETDPLILGSEVEGSALPHGWKRISSVNGGQSFECFEDDFTQSITLERPKMSLVKKRQVQIGLLQQHPSLSCHLDLLSCMRAGVGQEQRQTFEADLRSRFPDYDEAWYMSEWNTEPNTQDVLGELKEPWRIQTFTTFLDTPGLKHKVVSILVHVSGVLGSTVIVVAISSLLAAMTFAMWITVHWVAVGMILWLIWVLMWLVWMS
ncbi:serine threonine kinase [Fusarium circinatum]|uniref:Serine threonine kinase n=1 Tax=Fusarium circinatum TaxID=48490 RepID=A0A8H5WZR2_FUSCI|nr:serine threonine kinase [Fusarium circinatum]